MLNRLAVQQDRCSRQGVELCRSLNTKTIEKTKTGRQSTHYKIVMCKLRLIFVSILPTLFTVG